MLEFGRKNYFAEVTCQSEVRESKRRRELRDDVEHTNKVHCRRDETLRLDQVIFGVHRRTAIL